MPLTLPKKIFTEENDKQSGNTKISYTETLKNAKHKETVKVANTETHQKSPKRVTSTKVAVFQTEDKNIADNRKLSKRSKQKATEKSVPRENEVEGMNDLDLTSIFSSLLKDERKMTV